jgi:Trypsin-like peptidase domain
VVCAGLGAAWYRWQGDAAGRQKEEMARTAAAVARRVHPAPEPSQPKAATEARAADAPAPAADAAIVFGLPAAASAPAPAEVPLEDLVARVAPAVVAIETSAGRGSGFFVQPDTIITNAHVAGSDVTVRVYRMSGDPITARVERVATDLDLAVLRLPAPLPNQPIIALGEVSRVRSGEDVVAIGSALGVLQNSVTRGIVSAVRRSGTVTLIQTDAAINPGNSGGPLMDRAGIVIGINTMTARSAQGISFAVAVDHARELMTGQHVATTASTPLSTMNETLTGSSGVERSRDQAVKEYEQVLVKLARRADDLDDYWRRFRKQCYEGRIVTAGFDHEWFALFDPRAMQGAVTPGCGQSFNEARNEASTVKNTLDAAEDAARRADIFPGTRRELRHKYHLEYPGWDR